jgi:hypothetical protein
MNNSFKSFNKINSKSKQGYLFPPRGNPPRGKLHPNKKLHPNRKEKQKVGE